jgi:hypothetical protein
MLPLEKKRGETSLLQINQVFAFTHEKLKRFCLKFDNFLKIPLYLKIPIVLCDGEF